VAETDPSLALDPRTGAATVASTRIAAAGTARVVLGLHAQGAWRAEGFDDPMYARSTDATVVFAAPDTRALVWLGGNAEGVATAVRFAQSVAGAGFDGARTVNAAGLCAAGCTSPTLASWGDGSLALAYVAHAPDGDASLWLHTRTAGAEGFGEGARMAGVVLRGDNHVEPTLATLAASPTGRLALVWLSQRRENTRAALGDSYNTVSLLLREAGAAGWSAPLRVSPEGSSVVGHRPAVALSADAVHVLHVRGGPDGRWHLDLTTRDTTGQWRIRRLGYGSEGCATRGWPGLVAASDGLWASWIDTALGTGVAWATRCPFDAGLSCEAPRRVSGEGFGVYSGVDAMQGHGTRTAVAVEPSGGARVVWSDTRDGTPRLHSGAVR